MLYVVYSVPVYSNRSAAVLRLQGIEPPMYRERNGRLRVGKTAEQLGNDGKLWEMIEMMGIPKHSGSQAASIKSMQLSVFLNFTFP